MVEFAGRYLQPPAAEPLVSCLVRLIFMGPVNQLLLNFLLWGAYHLALEGGPWGRRLEDYTIY